MRVLQVAPPWFSVPPRGYGGIEGVVAGLADGLVDAGHDVTLLASGGSRTKARLHTTYDAPPSSDLGDVVTELLHVVEADVLGSFDVVHDHTLIGATRMAARGDVPVVHTLHGPWSPRLRALARRLAPTMSLVAISRDQARRARGVQLAGVVHNGIDLDAHPLGLDRGDVLGFVGRANVEKGPEVAIEVARRTGLPLVMALKVNEAPEITYFDEVLRPLLRGLDVELVRNADHAQKVAIMGTCRAMLAPIQWPEPFGLVMAESGACGAPVVAFSRGAAPEIVVDGVTGFLVDRREGVDGLCAALDRVDGIDPATCRDHVERHFSRRAMVTGYESVYRDAVRHASDRAGPLVVTEGPR